MKEKEKSFRLNIHCKDLQLFINIWQPMSQLLGGHCINQEKGDSFWVWGVDWKFWHFKVNPSLPFKSTGGYFPLLLFFSLLATTIKLLERSFTGVLDVSRPNGRLEHDEIDTGEEAKACRTKNLPVCDLGVTGWQLVPWLTVAFYPHHRHNLERKRNLSLIYRDYIRFSCQESGGNFHFHRITPLFCFESM